MTLARTPYARLSPADIGQVDRELKKLEQMSAGLYVPKVLVAARSPYTVQGTDTMLLCDCTAGAITLTFPLAARVDGMCVQVVKSDTSTNAVTLSGTFGGVVNPTVTAQYSALTIVAMNGVYQITAGAAAVNANDPLMPQTSAGHAAYLLNVTHYTVPASFEEWANAFSELIISNALDGGINFLTPNYSNKRFWHALGLYQNTFTPGQHFALRMESRNYSIGDTGSILANNYAWGGFYTSGDEGTLAADFFAAPGYVEYTGTVSGGAGTGSTSLTITPTQGAGTQGAFRFLVNSTRKVAVTISVLTGGDTGNTPGSATVTSHGLGASTVNTTMSSAGFAPGFVTVTPASMTGITAGLKLMIAGSDGWEMVLVQSITGTTFTATFRKPHKTGSVIAAGGATGYFLEISADNVDNTIDGAITGTMHYIWPIISSASNTAVTIWMGTQDSYIPYQGRWGNVGGWNGGNVYPGAEVVSVQSGGAVSNTLTLAPNTANWVSGDTVFLPEYPAQVVYLGNGGAVNHFPPAYPGAGGGWHVALSGLPSGRTFGHKISNGAPNALYTSYGGRATPPEAAYECEGLWQYAFEVAEMPQQSLIRVGSIPTERGGTAGNNSWPILQFPNNHANWDFLSFNPSTYVWALSAALGGAEQQFYAWSPTAFYAFGASLGSAANAWFGAYIDYGAPIVFAHAGTIRSGFGSVAARSMEANDGHLSTDAGNFTGYSDWTARSLFASGDQFQQTQIKQATVIALPTNGTASYTATALVPAGCILIGVTTRVRVAFAGMTSLSIGDGTTVDQFASAVAGLTVGSTTDLRNHKTTWAPKLYTAAGDVVITANGGTLNGGSQMRLTAHYIALQAATIA